MLNKKKKREEIKQKTKNEKMKANNRNIGTIPYNMYPNMYMHQINGPNQGFINEYPNYMPYRYSQIYQYPPYFHQFFIEQPKNLEENVNQIYQRGIVNNIIAAFFIKENQEKLKEKKIVPVAKVELVEDNDNGNDANIQDKTTGMNKNENINEDSVNKIKNENEKNTEEQMDKKEEKNNQNFVEKQNNEDNNPE